MLAYNQFSCARCCKTRPSAGKAWPREASAATAPRKSSSWKQTAWSTKPRPRRSRTQGAYNSYYNLTPLGTVSTSARRPHFGAEHRHADLQLDHEHQRPRLCHAAVARGDPMHRLRRHLRAHRLRQRTEQCRGLSSELVHARRDYVSKLFDRSRQRLQVVHRDPQSTSGQAQAGIHYNFRSNDPVDHLGEVIQGRLHHGSKGSDGSIGDSGAAFLSGASSFFSSGAADLSAPERGSTPCVLFPK